MDYMHARATLVQQWGVLLGMPEQLVREMGTTTTPDDATARRWLRRLAESLSDDPAEISLRLALLIAAEAPGTLADSTTVDFVMVFADMWAARLLDLARENRDPHADTLLALAPLVADLPSDVAHAAVERLWTALHDDDDWRSQHMALRALCLLLPHLDPAIVRAMVASHDEKVIRRGLTLASVMGDHAPIPEMLAALGRDVTKWEAAQALVALGDAAPVDALLDIVAHHPNVHMREATATALSAISDRVPFDAILPLIQGKHANTVVRWADHLPIEDLVNALFQNDYALGLLLPTVLRRRDEVPRALLYERLQAPLYETVHGLQFAQTRYYAARILHALGEPVALPPLLATIARDGQHFNIFSFSEGLRTLGILGDPGAIDFLIDVLQHRTSHTDGVVRAAAAEALGMLGEAVPLAPLLAALDDPKVEVCHAAAQALRHLGTRVPVDVWLAHLADDLTLDALMAFAAYPDIAYDGMIMQTIWRTHCQPLHGIRVGNSRDADQQFAEILAAWAPRLTPNLIAANMDDLPEMRQSAAAVLGAIGTPAALDALVAATADADPAVRLAVIRAMGTRAPIEALRRLADDAVPWVSSAATEMLGQLDARPLEDLLAKARSAVNQDERMAALRALGTAAPVDLLVAHLTDRYDNIDLAVLDLLVAVDGAAAYQAVMEIRQRTGRGHLRALGHLGERAPLDVLRAGLFDDSSYNPSTNAVEALLDLGQLGDDADPEMLAQVGEVLAVATDAANRHDHYKGQRDMDTYGALERLIRRLPPLAGMAVLAAFARGDTEYTFKRRPARLPSTDDIPRIIAKTLTSRQDWVREIAGLVLVHWRGRLPLPVIVEALHDLDAEVRPLAAWLLGQVGDASIIAPLQDALADPACARPAAIALHRLGVRDVVIPDPPSSLLGGFTPPLEDEDDIVAAEFVPLESLLADLGAAAAETRAAAITALGQHRSLPVERITWALGDSDQRVRDAAVDVLRISAPTELAALLQSAVTTLRGVPAGVFQSLPHARLADLLAGIHADTTLFAPMLHTLLDWPYFEVRLHAVRAIPALTGDPPHELLRRVLELRHDAHSRAVCAATDDALAALVAHDILR